MTAHDYGQLRLRGWARWVAANADGLGYPQSSTARLEKPNAIWEDPDYRARLPIDELMAVETDEAVMQLDRLRREVVASFYLRNDSIDGEINRLRLRGRHMSVRTYWRRLDEAIGLVGRLLVKEDACISGTAVA